MSKIKKELRIETMPVFIDKFEIFFLQVISYLPIDQ